MRAMDRLQKRDCFPGASLDGQNPLPGGREDSSTEKTRKSGGTAPAAVIPLRPAPARYTARVRGLSNRVSRFPRIGSTAAWGNRVPSCNFRRALEDSDHRIFCGGGERQYQCVARIPPPEKCPQGQVGRRFHRDVLRLCTAKSIFPSRRAASNS